MITKTVVDFWESKGFEYLYTGGGYDYMVKFLDGSSYEDGYPVIVLSGRFSDESPANMGSKVMFHLWLDEEWVTGYQSKLFKNSKSGWKWIQQFLKKSPYSGDQVARSSDAIDLFVRTNNTEYVGYDEDAGEYHSSL